MPALRPLIYNLHRLIDRCPAPSPTGVDRVDLRHARYVLNQAEHRAVLFVRQHQNIARLVPLTQARNIIDNIERRWLQGQTLTPAIRPSKLAFVRQWPDMRLHQQRHQLLESALQTALPSTDTPTPIYLHSGHGTLHHLELHQQIKSTLNADMVYYLHDLIPLDFPEYTNNPQAVPMHHRRMQTMATTGSLILANSEDSKDRFLHYCRKESLPQPPTHVVLIGVEEQIITATGQAHKDIPARYVKRLLTPYFMTIGTIEPRKNHILLLHLWRQLAEELGEQCPKLVILGKRGWKIDNLAHLLEKSPALIRHVIEVNDASDVDMIALLQHSQALVFPSFAEGWGMPLAEALTLGVPAICADIPALRECGREHAVYLNPLDGLGWKRAILAQLRSPQGVLNAPYRPDRWEEHIRRLDAHLNGLMEQNRLE